MLTDGRANVALRSDDPWKDALTVASELACRVLVVDTEFARNALGRAKDLAASIHADCVSLNELASRFDLASLLADRDKTPRR